jgi:hypothetical protein
MNMFDKDLGLDLLINRKKVGSDMASLVSGSGDSVIDIDSDAGSIKSINIKPNVVDVREHMQPSRPNINMGFNGRQNDYEEESVAYDSNSQSGSDGTSGTEEQSMHGYPTNNYNQQPQRRMMSEEEIINAKREILYQFERMERKGMQLPRKFTMASSLEEMRLELDRLKKDREIDQSVKFQRKVMMTVVTGAELLNNKFDPVGARLDGWSESINDNIDDYDEVFEELHDKYKGKAKMAPEFKLMFMLGGSAFMFHMTNTMFKTQMPGLDQVLKQNPELMRQFAAATASTMQQNTAESNPMMSGLSGMFSNMFGGNSGQQPSAPQRPPQPQYAPQQASRPNMKGPSNVDDILREIERENMNDRVEMMSTITQSELSELGDDASINGLLMNKRGKGGKKGLNLDI